MSYIIRSFEIRVRHKSLVCNLSRYLDDKLCELQNDGWEIINIVSTNVKEWDYPEYFDSTLFTIIAKHKK